MDPEPSQIPEQPDGRAKHEALVAAAIDFFGKFEDLTSLPGFMRPELLSGSRERSLKDGLLHSEAHFRGIDGAILEIIEEKYKVDGGQFELPMYSLAPGFESPVFQHEKGDHVIVVSLSEPLGKGFGPTTIQTIEYFILLRNAATQLFASKKIFYSNSGFDPQPATLGPMGCDAQDFKDLKKILEDIPVEKSS